MRIWHNGSYYDTMAELSESFRPYIMRHELTEKQIKKVNDAWKRGQHEELSVAIEEIRKELNIQLWEDV